MKEKYDILGISVIAAIILLLCMTDPLYGDNMLWKGRFKIENPGPGYKVTADSSSLAAGTNLFDLISVLPGVTYENSGFCINGTKISGIYINDVKIYSMYGLKYISTDGLTSIRVTYAPGGDSSSDSDGGKIKIYFRKPQDGVYGKLSAGTSFIPGKGFGNAVAFSGTDISKGKFSFSNILQYAALTTRKSSITNGSTETTSGPECSLNDKMYFRYSHNKKNSLSASVTLRHEYERPVSAAVDNTRKYTNLGSEIIYSMSIPDKMEMSASVSYASVNEHRDNKYLSGSGSGGSAGIHTDDIDASLTGVFRLTEDHNLIAGMEFEAILSGYRLLSSYGETSFDDNVGAAGTQSYVSRLYSQIDGRFGRVRYNAGINFQSNNLSYTDNTNGKSAQGNRLGVSPTLKLNMPFDREERFSMDLIYRHSMGTIPYKAIIPFRYWAGESAYSTGNPGLKVPSSDICMLALNLFSGALNAGISYRHDRNGISTGYFPDAENPEITCITPVNLGSTRTASINIGASFTKSSWIKSRLFLRGDLIKENSTLEGVMYDNLRTRIYVALNNSLRFGEGFGAEVNARFCPGYTCYEKTYFDDFALYGSVFRTFLSGDLRVALNFTAKPAGPTYRTQTVTYTDLGNGSYVGISSCWTF